MINEFRIKNVQRIASDMVQVTVTMENKTWAKHRAKGNLGALYGVDISNHAYKEYGVKAYNPTVCDRDNAAKGIKTIKLIYTDSDWSDVSAEIIHVDFSARKRIA